MKAIINGIILTQDAALRGKALLFDDIIKDIVDQDEVLTNGKALGVTEVIDAHGLFVAPGLIDVHIHGYVGEDTSDGQIEGVRLMAKRLPENGVTGFLPTTMTVSWDEIEKSFQLVRDLMPESQREDFDGAQILGCHAEGPFINPERKGAQSADHIIPPDADRLMAHKDVVKIVTMAPEMPGGMDFIRKVTQQSDIVVSIGHSSATFEMAKEAIDNGASHVTHLFNAQTGLNHRQPGIVGAALTSRNVSTELIADKFHVHPGLFSLLVAAKGDKLILVTDCTRAGGLPDGEYTLGGQPIFVKGIECRLADGTIAGSVLRLNGAVKNLYTDGGVPLYQAVHAASLSPAEVIGLSDTKGSLTPGKDADIILIDEDVTVYRTFVRGKSLYKKGE